MIPIEKISSSTLGNLLYYVAIIGVLLLIATIIRLKIPVLRKMFIPASLLAGFIGLFLGPRFIGVIPSDMMSSIGALPSHMITIVFACMLLGVKKAEITSELARDTVSSLFYCYGCSFAQVAIGCILTGALLINLFGVNPIFGGIWECSFGGGHGTAGGLASVFIELGYAEGADLAVTTATIGLLGGIFGGMVLVNWAVRKKYTGYVDAVADTTGRQEYYAESDRKPNAYGTVSNDVVEPFALHLGVIGLAILIGRAIVWFASTYFNYSLPLFPFAMVGGWICNEIIQHVPFLSKLFDRHIFQRISGMSMEVLIVAAVASINTTVIVDNAASLIIVSIAEFAAMFAAVIFLAPRVFVKDWFENAILRYGGMTGVAATGYLLLRCCDPESESEGATTYALGAPFLSPFIGGGFITTFCPYGIVRYGALPFGLICLALTLTCLVILRLFFWVKNPQLRQR